MHVDTRNAHKILIGKPKRKEHLRPPKVVDWRIILKRIFKT